jgi:hypothetical protein
LNAPAADFAAARLAARLHARRNIRLILRTSNPARIGARRLVGETLRTERS